jgi:hypothetical protein
MQPRPADTTTPPIGPAGAADGSGGTDPAEGRPDLGIPGADRPDVEPGPQDDLPERLGQRIENGSSSGIASGEPDVLPDVEVPEETM